MRVGYKGDAEGVDTGILMAVSHNWTAETITTG